MGSVGAAEVLKELPKHVDVLHDHIDKTLDIRPMLESGLKSLSPHEFEGVLHPVFEEEEFILIIAGAVLGAAAGAIQYMLSDIIRGNIAKEKERRKADSAAEVAIEND